MSLREIAQKYINAGFSIVPIKRGEKMPCVKWEEYQKRRATHEELNQWFKTDTMNIGIVTGKISGISVVDVDLKNGGLETLKQLGLPITWTVKTGGGGWHYYYKYDERAKQTAGIYQGVDIRNDGGQVVAPPSLHKSGNRYEWTYKEGELVDFPIHLFETKNIEKKNWAEILTTGSKEGNRNQTASSLIGKLMTLFHPDQWETSVWEIARYWNSQNKPPMQEIELHSVFSSIAKRAINNLVKPINDIIAEIKTPLQIAKVIKEKSQLPKKYHTWGIDMDERLPLLEPHLYMILFGQFTSGKTTFAMNLARANAQKSKVCFLSLEMSKEKLIELYALKRAGVTKEEYKVGNYDRNIFEQYAEEINTIDFVGIDIEQQRKEYTVADIEEIVKTRSPEIIIIDNLNKLKGKGKTELELSAEVSHQLLTLTRQYPVTVILIHHANKPQNEKKPKALRGISGLRGTNKVNDDADIVCELARKVMEEGNVTIHSNSSLLAVYKDRNWDCKATIDLLFANGKFVDDSPSGYATINPLDNIKF